MTAQGRAQRIESYGNAHAQLVDALRRFPKEMWEFKSSPDEWSIHEMVVHIADSEANSYVRCRRFIAEPGKSVMAYDENQWGRALSYHDQSADEALELFRSLRQASYRLISSLPEPVWSHTVYHPENGTMTMDDWLGVYERHIPDHVRQMQAVYDQLLKQGKARPAGQAR